MKITLLNDEAVRLENDHGPMTIEALTPDQQYSPFHMVASGLAVCTYSVLHSWATHAKLDAASLAIEVAWRFADAPHRVGAYEMKLIWPGLPEARREVAKRATSLCTVHATLLHPPTIDVQVTA